MNCKTDLLRLGMKTGGQILAVSVATTVAALQLLAIKVKLYWFLVSAAVILSLPKEAKDKFQRPTNSGPTLLIRHSLS